MTFPENAIFKHLKSVINITFIYKIIQRNSKIPKGQTEIVKSEDRQNHGLVYQDLIGYV